MATQARAKPTQTQTVEEKIQQLRELYADAPEVGRAALETLVSAMKAAGAPSGPKVTQNETSAGRTGLRQGKVSELTALLKLVPGGAERIRAVLDAGRNLRIADRVGTLHDMRVKHQVPASGWYVGNPNVTVRDTRKLEKIGAAVEEFLEKIA